MIRFESPLEKLVYNEIKRIAGAHKLMFHYQYKITTVADWYLKKIRDASEFDVMRIRRWAVDHNIPIYVEKYRLDFALIERPGDWKFDVEVDGKEFHDEELDDERDEYLESRGWTVIRIKSSQLDQESYWPTMENLSSKIWGLMHG